MTAITASDGRNARMSGRACRLSAAPIPMPRNAAMSRRLLK
jgi:hypothetical protein